MTITIKTRNGADKKIDADLYGEFATHRAQNWNLQKRAWTVTHTPTGVAVQEGFASKWAAQRFIEQIETTGIDFAEWKDAATMRRVVTPQEIQLLQDLAAAVYCEWQDKKSA